ncbi:replication initiator [Catenuloplanes atrovinosus]|uniref:Plasmid replication initiator protein n=1 Tax=Catenuloplanes atrovinosus TaxID=137266 RepID=A0AAE3YJK9_9ACTN|nr:replication initiator [Catenuloplanes atrovinosus]MDR7273610.1 hypothetical protein [Catenuloplanes atrovinosus]
MTATADLGSEQTLRLEWLSRFTDIRNQAIARAARPDYEDWLEHVRPAAGCTRPIRLSGSMATIDAGTGRLLHETSTAGMPDGMLYKPCGNRRERVCPHCSARYKRDAYQVVKTLMVGGKGVSEQVATHPAVFPTFTAPSFGEVHTRYVERHTCRDRRLCDCRPEPCHARRNPTVCPHGVPIVCFARHESADRRLGTPLCVGCYDYDGQAVWNVMSGELWRRTTITIRRRLRQLAQARGLTGVTTTTIGQDGQVRTRRVSPVRVTYGKASEMQRRAVIHFHVICRLDGIDPADPTAVVPPPAELDAQDLKQVIEDAARSVEFTTPPHPANPDGWLIRWGDQLDVKLITVAANGEITDEQVARYLAKYATKSTEATGYTSARLDRTDLGTLDLYATHPERLAYASWMLGRYADWRRLRRWAHQFGYGGHPFTKSRTHRVTFSLLRQARRDYVRALTTGPESSGRLPEPPTTLVVSFLEFVGSGWLTPADAMLANTSAALAREHQQAARQHLAALAA